MTKEEAKNTISEVLACLDNHDAEKWRSFYAEDLQYHLIGMPKTLSLDEYWHSLNARNEKYTDFQHAIDDSVAEQITDTEWKVAIIFSVSIVHIATGKPVSGTGMALFRINNGKIVEQWDKLNPPQV